MWVWLLFSAIVSASVPSHKINILVSDGKLGTETCAKIGRCQVSIGFDSIGDTRFVSMSKTLPSWIHIFRLRDFGEVELERVKSIACSKTGWKILFGPLPIFSNGASGNLNIPKVNRLVDECGIQIYVSGADRHQEHLTAENFETFIIGSAKRIDDVDQKNYKPGDSSRQNFARSEKGFGIIEVSPETASIRFFSEDLIQNYYFKTFAHEVGLRTGMR